MLELTVQAEPRELARVRVRVGEALRARGRTEDHRRRVSLVASELPTLSMLQGNETGAVLRVVELADGTRVELVDRLAGDAAFDDDSGHLVTRLASIRGVVREPSGTRTVWCDVGRGP